MEKATFAAGCFWHVEEAFRTLPGVLSTAVGYMGGTMVNPSYEDVYTDETGHAEVVQVEFDPAVISYEKLLERFWGIHNPTTLNRQGADVGTRYRSAVFYHNDEQKKLAEASMGQQAGRFRAPVVTQIVPAGTFYRGEDYHQKYLARRGRTSCGI